MKFFTDNCSKFTVFDRVYQYVTIPNTEEAAMRFVDWKRGGPYVFRNSDYEELLNSKMILHGNLTANVMQKLWKESLTEENKNGQKVFEYKCGT